jgi:hypothetical protein
MHPIVGQVGARGTLRIFTIIYVAQACVGIAAGAAYAVWLMYL